MGDVSRAIDIEEATAAVHFAADHGMTLIAYRRGYGPLSCRGGAGQSPSRPA